MNNYKKANQRKNRLKLKSKAGLALLTILVMIILAFSNILTPQMNGAPLPRDTPEPPQGFLNTPRVFELPVLVPLGHL